MTNRTKAIIAGAVVGAAAATVAIGCYLKKHVVVAKVHLFDVNDQADKESEIEHLIPTAKQEATEQEAPRPYCEKWEKMCGIAQDFLKKNTAEMEGK